MMKAAAIDLGTNTFHLIIAAYGSSGDLDILYKTNQPVRLGEGRLNENIIIPEAFERGLVALEQFAEEIRKYGVTTVRATATSAVRSAANGQDFVKAAKERSGITITAISGDEEAEYIFKGVKATGVIDETSLIMDIGGGSTEFILCNEKELLWKKSYDLGAARLMQAYFHSDPINNEDQLHISTHLYTQTATLREAITKHQPKHLIGSAGAFETFAGMLEPELNVKLLKSHPIHIDAYRHLSATFINSTHAERAAMQGLIPLRVDMIVMASLLTDYILRISGIQRISLSTYDLKMGVLYSIAESEGGSTN
ncbi:exopolyphosphatase [Pedobacter sp. BAL39]|uniref:Ppx/GppA phosphatase family protein n=1 Tax=Pedobacter sp. BAL39 TaxID=391596 RepID=UPI0001559D75|nr:exopolyphosphatase [Pedobacter sp. BAL39]EDM38693.1 exopolyphosphatase [Pedobacter sp. BAL39]